MLVFNEDVAVIVGVEPAVLFQNIVYWIEKNESNKRHYHDGQYWTYNSASAYAKMFPFWSQAKVSRMIDVLVSKEMLVLGNYNEKKYDRTSWYALTNYGKSFSRICKMDSTDLNNAFDESAKPIPNINTNINTNIKTNNIKKSQPIQKNRFGSFSNVLLSQDEYDKLSSKFGRQDADKRIERLSIGIESKGYKYKSHYATILQWAQKEEDMSPTQHMESRQSSIPNLWETKR